MGCYHPLRATQFHGGEILVHKRTPGLALPSTSPELGRDLNLPCGRCIGCKIDTTRTWAIRCLHESQQHRANAFLTLTIRAPNPVDLSSDRSELQFSSDMLAEWPSTETLSKRTHQRFVKRLRKKVGPLRYYMCGEYGEKLARPHYHYLIFGHNFPDKYYSHTSVSGEKLYISPTLNLLWPWGKAWIGDVTYESCAYVAAYVMKKLNGARAEEHYKRTDEAGCDYWLQPEFSTMSRRPGIAKEWWLKFNQDVHTDDVVITHKGAKLRPPRYYDKLLALMDPVALEVIKMKREARAKELAGDNTPARLAVKETVTKARMALKKRNLEQS